MLKTVSRGVAKHAATALVLLLVAAGTAAAQPVRPIQLTDIRGYLQLGTLYESKERSRDDLATSSAFDRLDFSEMLRLDLSGYVYHPRFFTFHCGYQLEAIQAAMDGEGRLPMGVDWRFNLLERHSFGFSLFGRYVESEVTRRYERSFAMRDQLYGATFYYRLGRAPFDLSYRYRSRLGIDAPSQRDEVGNDIELNMRYRLSESSSGELLYDATIGERLHRDIRRQEFLLTNVTYFDEKRASLTGDLHLRENLDQTDLYTATAFLDLNVDHTKTFSTRYRLDFRGEARDSDIMTSWSPRLRLRHQLYESLSTRAEIYGDLWDASSGAIREYGGILRESYTKRLGSWGKLHIGINPHVRLTQRRPDTDTAPVFGEELTIPPFSEGPWDVELAQPNIKPETIRVIDESDPTCVEEPFPPCSEFSTQPSGDMTLLIPGAGLRGRTVRIEYEYELGLRGDLLVSNVNLRASLRLLDHGMLYGRFDREDRTRIAGSLDQRLDPRNRQIAGVKLFWPWIDARVEFENQWAPSRASFWAILESFTLARYGKGTWSARLHGSHRYQQNTDSDQRVSRLTLGGLTNARITRRGLLEIQADYWRERWQGENSGGANDLDGLDMQADFTWWYGAIEVKAEGRLRMVFQPGEEDTETRFGLRVRRTF